MAHTPERLRRSGRGAVTAGPLPGHRQEPAGQRGPAADSDELIVRYNPEVAGRDNPRQRQAHRHQTRRAARQDLHDARAEPVPAHHPGGLLRVDKAKAEENLDGKYLLRCADPKFSPEDIALGYKQPWKSSAAGGT